MVFVYIFNLIIKLKAFIPQRKEIERDRARAREESGAGWRERKRNAEIS